MFDAIDESIKNLLIKEIPVTKNEIDIVFDQPTDEWSARVGKPTLNLFLYDIRENRSLRGAEQFSEQRLSDGSTEIRRNPPRIDLYFLITAWSKKEQDQHHLLGLTLMALLRSPRLPKEVYADGLGEQPAPVQLEVAQPDETKNWSDFWSTLNNKYRPGLVLKVTVLVDPYQPVTSPTVTSTEMRFVQEDPVQGISVESKRYWAIGGEIVSEKYDPSTLTLTWEEKGKVLDIEEGLFQIPKIMEGTYHLSIQFNDRHLKRLKFNVPSDEQIKIDV